MIYVVKQRVRVEKWCNIAGSEMCRRKGKQGHLREQRRSRTPGAQREENDEPSVAGTVPTTGSRAPLKDAPNDASASDSSPSTSWVVTTLEGKPDDESAAASTSCLPSLEGEPDDASPAAATTNLPAK